MILVNYTKMTNIQYISLELLETLRLFNSTIYMELEEMYGTVQKSNLLSKLFYKSVIKNDSCK